MELSRKSSCVGSENVLCEAWEDRVWFGGHQWTEPWRSMLTAGSRPGIRGVHWVTFEKQKTLVLKAEVYRKSESRVWPLLKWKKASTVEDRRLGDLRVHPFPTGRNTRSRYPWRSRTPESQPWSHLGWSRLAGLGV